MKKSIVIGCIALLIQSTIAWADVSEEIIQKSFYPYKDSVPSYPGYEPGVVITLSNVEQFKDILVEALYDSIKAGRVILETIPTSDFSLHEAFVDATRKHADKVTIAPNGTLNNYVAGRPFPEELDANDPQAGLKLAWNFQYGFNVGDSAYINPFWWTFRNMKTGEVERTLKFEAHAFKWQQRVSKPPVPGIEPNPAGIYRSLYLFTHAPFDLANTQLLVHRYLDDTRRADSWLYLGFQRRVRRLASGQTTDAFLGTDLMIEDFEGYNGRITDYTWEYGGAQDVLLPFFNRDELKELSNEPANDPDGFRFLATHGKGNCYPKVPYQLRKAHTLIGTPKDPSHPLSKRVMTLDAQTVTMAITSNYDKKGNLWKYYLGGKSHPDHHLPVNKGVGATIDDYAALIDLQAEHCTTLGFKMYMKEQQDPKTFSVQNLRKAGR